jgi:hypothetical protein
MWRWLFAPAAAGVKARLRVAGETSEIPWLQGI